MVNGLPRPADWRAGLSVGLMIMELLKIGVPAVGDEALANRADIIRERLSSAIQLVDEMVAAPVTRTTGQGVTEQEVRAILKQRRNRDRFFDTELFADPAWDILLELYASQLGQQRIAITTLCARACVPPTTALRWIKLLETKALIERRPDPRDARRVFLSLSGTALHAMENYFRTVPRTAQPI